MLRPLCWKQEICVGICFKENSVFSYLEFHIQNLYPQRTFSVKISKKHKGISMTKRLISAEINHKKSRLEKTTRFYFATRGFFMDYSKIKRCSPTARSK